MTADSQLVVLALHWDGRPTAQLLLSGELDLDTGPLLAHALAPLLADRGIRRIEVDVALLGFCDAGGLSALLAAQRRATDRGVVFYLIQIRAPLQKVLDAAGLGRLLHPPHGNG
ncbi:STAS domain-containing protein [Streptacidiphilus sp. EB129]|uniref:STAS domain-containing protein n=1 Tax=Streptacidiphilus sp. EB129 TaxID=3156262 RepID=UPI00351645BB